MRKSHLSFGFVIKKEDKALNITSNSLFSSSFFRNESYFCLNFDRENCKVICIASKSLAYFIRLSGSNLPISKIINQKEKTSAYMG